MLSHIVLAGLYDEDLDDAAEHQGLTLLKSKWYSSSPEHADMLFMGESGSDPGMPHAVLGALMSFEEQTRPPRISPSEEGLPQELPPKNYRLLVPPSRMKGAVENAL
jgi:hypothetical protein